MPADSLLVSAYIFILAVFAGLEVITKIPPTLHTPLMSGANAISGITVVGAVLIAGRDGGTTGAIIGFFALTIAMINVVGGFMVTDRMLQMFRRSPVKGK
jgi:NAD(P) transhydrogenase subunit alpha